MPTLSVISPVYCESDNITVFLDALEASLAPLDHSYEIILIDDGSTDDSWHCMRREAEKRSALRCLRFSRNFGKEAALAAGLDEAKGEAIIVMDSDLQHPPSLIAEMTRIWRDDEADIVEAVKETRQKESFANRLFATLFYKTYAFFTSDDIEGASDFKLLDRSAVDALKQLGESRVFFRGMTRWLGFRRRAIPFTPPERGCGSGKWSFPAKLRLALDSLTAYSAKPLSAIFLLTVLFCLFAVLTGGEALLTWLNGEAMSGFTTVILLILISAAAVLTSICVLALYIRQIFYEAKKRPRYLISERTRQNETRRRRGLPPPRDGSQTDALLLPGR
ncbi:MAG: glycosyltransferase family 2 protein [Desulfovibrio sp.]|jgi:dolichol-phosphate mannosyltransferase|nr:glycosyltransferase family 2 protein [Desulfovibrio sp.]